MHSHYGFHTEFAQDRQSQLFRDAGVDGPAAPHLTVIAANERAEIADNRRQGRRLNVASALVARAALRGSGWMRPGLAGV